MAYGATVSEREIPAGPLTHIYYVISLFVLGGLDLGTPSGGPQWAHALLWGVYFAAPLVTASAVLEIVWAIALPMAYRLRRLRDHTVIIGAGRLTELYLQKLREHSPRAQIVLVDRNPDKRSPFSTQVADECNIVLFAIAELVAEGLPLEWCAPTERTWVSDDHAYPSRLQQR